MTEPLSAEDLAVARVELAEGRPVTVWFTSAAVGVPAGGSAKVVSVDDVAEGDFIQVRPAGSRDTMFCSPNELTRTRPPRKPRAQRVPEPVPEPVAAPVPKPVAALAPAPRAVRPVPDPPAEPVPAAVAPPAEKRPRQAARPAEVTVTLAASAEGEWTVEVVVGRKRTVRPTPVQPADVAKAARSLPSAVAEAIDASLEAARRRQIERVERLRAELDAAQRALHELTG